MRQRNGFIELTWKETIEVWSGVWRQEPFPWWFRTFAPLQHWIAVTFRGHQPYDIGQRFHSEPIPRTTPPRCARCFAPLASCEHDPDRPFAPLPE